MTPVTETDYRRNCLHQNLYCQCRKLAFKKHCFLQSQFPALTTSFGVDSTACSSNSAILSTGVIFLSREPVSTDLNFPVSEKDWINAHARQGLTLSGSQQSRVVCVIWDLVSMYRFIFPDKDFILL